MPRPRTAVPVPRNHKGRAVLDVYENGIRRTRTLGGWGTPEADAEYKRFLAEFATGQPSQPTGPGLTVNEVLLAFMRHAEQHYRRADGSQTNEVVEYKILVRLVRELYGHVPAAEFGSLGLKTVRQRMVGKDLARTHINNRIRRLKHVFKWAAGEELVPFDVYQRLTAVAGLQKGRTAVRETTPVGPVADADVDAVLPFLSRHVRGLVEFQRLAVNHKRVERLWRREGLKVPSRQRPRRRLWLNDGSCVRLRPEHPGHVWSYDFVKARTTDGRAVRRLTVIDEYTRECLAIGVGRKLTANDVLDRLSELFILRGVPAHIRSDNGPEFAAKAVRGWLGRLGVRTLFIEPGSPWENGYVERFNGKLRDELLDAELFDTLQEARVLVERWRRVTENCRRLHARLVRGQKGKPRRV